MLDIFKNIKNFLPFILLFSFMNSEIEIKTLSLKEEGITIDNLTIDTYFKIISNFTVLPYFIEIKVQDNSLTNLKEEIYINHIISYYRDDSKFEERKQLSQNITGTTKMILTNEQIKNYFYLSVECSKLPCNYILTIKSLDIVELILGEQYSYYVSEENKEMNFIIKGNIEYVYNLTEYENGIISIWVKGSKDIISELKEKYTDKHPKYNSYIIKINGEKEIEYNILIKGTLGDYINVGSLFFEGKINLTCPMIFTNNGIELTGFLKKNSLDKICYKFSKNTSIYETLTLAQYDHQFIINFDEDNSSQNYVLDCYSLPDKAPYDELFYSIHFMKNTKYDGQGMNKYSPQVLGINYERYIEEGQSIGIIPMKPDDNFKFLTYYININDKRVNLYMYICNTYPLCSTDSKQIKNKKSIRNYGSASITYSKEELPKNLSPISKNQEIILIECEDDKEDKTECIIDLNIYTNKEKILLMQYFLSLGYVRKDNEDNYYIDTKNEAIAIYLNIEILQGDLSSVYQCNKF